MSSMKEGRVLRRCCPMTREQLINKLAHSLAFCFEEVDHDYDASIVRFAHGKHAFEVRYPDGKKFRVAVDECE